MERIKEILDNYDAKGLRIFKESVNELFEKGFANGCFQDYGVVADISRILSICEAVIKDGQNIEGEE